MSSRPRRTAATKAKDSITIQARADSHDKENNRSTMSSRRTNRASSPGESHLDVTVKVSSNKLRQATGESSRRSGGDRSSWAAFRGDEIVHGKRDRGTKKNYVVDSSDDDEDEEEEARIDDDDDDEMDDAEEDAEGEDDMDVDEEEEDAEGDVDMEIPPPSSGPTIKISRPSHSKPSARPIVPDDDDDDDELSDPDSDINDQTLAFGDQTGFDDEDAEGEDAEIAGEDTAGVDSDDEDEGEPDLAKMTKRQRARFEDGPQEFMKLSDEVQAKKVFTAEELSMRRQEMARRRRNLSEKRNEEVKMETINKLLKKQAPKINKKALAAAAAAEADPQEEKADPVFIRWTSTRAGVSVSVPEGILGGPVGGVFRGKMVEEVE